MDCLDTLLLELEQKYPDKVIVGRIDKLKEYANIRR